ncbi:MAG: hypothetical protein LC808_44775 [Actinobacteria bacterium]|nr:hypothetical protein [Actinomycetota bacterium]
MAPIAVELGPPHSGDYETEAVIIEDIDQWTDTVIVMGCGDDNPYR